MCVKNNGLSKYFKIIRQFIKCHAGEGDAVSARQAVEAITHAAEQGNAPAQYMLGMYYYTFCCEDSSRFLPWMERAAEADNMKAIKFLADYYRFVCDDMEPERRMPLGRKWLYRMIEVLTKKADKGVASAAKSLMNLYVNDRPDDMTEKEGRDAALAWHERLIDILRAKAEKGTAKDKRNLADALYHGCDVPEEIDSDLPDRVDEAMRRYEEVPKGNKDGGSY